MDARAEGVGGGQAQRRAHPRGLRPHERTVANRHPQNQSLAAPRRRAIVRSPPGAGRRRPRVAGSSSSSDAHDNAPLQGRRARRPPASQAARDKSAEAGRGATEPARARPCARQTSPRRPSISVTAQTRSSGCHPTPTRRTTKRQRLRGRRSAQRRPSRATRGFSHRGTRRTRATRPAAINSVAAPTPCASRSHKLRSSKASRPTTPGRAQSPGNSSRSATPSLRRSPATYSRLRYGPAKATGSAPARVEAPGDPRADQGRGNRRCAHDTIHQAGRRQPCARVC